MEISKILERIESFMNENDNREYFFEKYRDYLNMEICYENLEKSGLDNETRFVVAAALYAVYEYCIDFQNLDEIRSYENKKKKTDKETRQEIELLRKTRTYITEHYPETGSTENEYLKPALIFEILEKMNWGMRDGKKNYHKNVCLKELKEAVRALFLFWFYRDGDNFDKIFKKDLSNLLINEFAVKGGKSGLKASMHKDFDFLDQRFNRKECLEILNLLSKHRESNSNEENMDVVERAVRKFFEEDSDFSKDDLNILFNMLSEGQEDNPGLLILLFDNMNILSYEELQLYFPPENKKSIMEDMLIYLEVEQEDSIKDGTTYVNLWNELSVPLQAIKNDVSRAADRELSEQRMKLLSELFLLAVCRLVNDSNVSSEAEELFLKVFKSGEWKETQCLEKILNMLSGIIKIRKENPFEGFNIEQLYKSSIFESNKAILTTFYNLIQFEKNGSIATLNQLNFIDTYKAKLNPEDSRYKSPESIKNLHEWDCGFGEFVYQEMPVEGWSYRRPMIFKLWLESDENVKSNNKEAKRKIKREKNSNNLDHHYFYTADRNIVTHSIVYKSVEIVLEDSVNLLEALWDINVYFERLETEYSETKYIRYLKKKYERIMEIIHSVEGKELYDENGNTKKEFDIKTDFGELFYKSIQEFLEKMYVSDKNLLNEESFGLWIYMLYITYTFIKKDASATEEQDIKFNVPEDEIEKARDFFEENDDDFLEYRRFFYQIRTLIDSQNINKWKALPVSIIMLLHNGSFDCIPEYVKKMEDVMKDAKKIWNYRKTAEITEITKKEAIDCWKNVCLDYEVKIKQSEIKSEGCKTYCSFLNTVNTFGNEKRPDDILGGLEYDLKEACKKSISCSNRALIHLDDKIRSKYEFKGYRLSFTCFNEDDEDFNFYRKNEIRVIPDKNSNDLIVSFVPDFGEKCEEISVKIHSCQYKKIFAFRNKFREWWNKKPKLHFIEETHVSDKDVLQKEWIERKINQPVIKKVFKETASKIFDFQDDPSVIFNEAELYKKMKMLAIEKEFPLCSAKKVCINGIEQVLLYTALEIKNTVLAFVPESSESMIDVYYGEKKNEADKPLFSFPVNMEISDVMIHFIGELSFIQKEKVLNNLSE